MSSSLHKIDSNIVVEKDRSPWLQLEPNSMATARLYCFSHIGGSASTFKQWPNFLDASIEMGAAQLPGRENRRNEPVCRNLSELIEAYLPIILEDERPFTLFGHSFGSIVAFVLATQLTELGREPNALVVSAKQAPYLTPRQNRSKLPRIQLMEEMQKMGGTHPSVLNDNELMDDLLKAVRADFSVLESFKPDDYDVQLDCPIKAFAAVDDHLVSPASVEGWCEYTTTSFDFIKLTGGHFYINDHPDKLFKVINQTLSVDVV